MITVRFFAMLRGLAGCESAEFDAGPSGATTLDELKDRIRAEHPGLAPVLDSRSVMISVNQEFAAGNVEVRDGDEVALLPPFSGGKK